MAAVQDSPLQTAAEKVTAATISQGKALPEKFANVAWGETQPNGLRAAWVLEPGSAEHRIGEALKARLLVQNVGKLPVMVRVPTWHQGGVSARDATDVEIEVSGIEWTTMARLVPVRLGPGEFIEISAPGVGLGKDAGRGPWAGPRVGSNVLAKDGTELTLIQDNKPLVAKSFNIGTVRARENKIKDEETAKLHAWVKENASWVPKLRGVGTGGNIHKIGELAGVPQGGFLKFKKLEQLTEDRARVEELIKQINDAIASIPPPEQLTPFSEARGRMPWPVNGRALNNFGESYSDGNLHRQGLVLAADAGSPVRAVHPGRVVFSDWLRGSGLLVVVDHGDGYLSLYANNQTLVKNTGDWVNRGEAVATAGDNGGLNQPGIYFEIRRHGEALDPAAWCES